MIDNLIQSIARLLAAIYELPVIGGSYGLAIMVLTLMLMVLVMPLTLKATKSTIKMSMVAPELKRLQKEFKDDKERLNTEMMELYREHGINPVGGCLPILAQAPVFLILFQVIRGLTRRVEDAPFTDVVNKVFEVSGRAAPPNFAKQFYPHYLSPDSQMYQDLVKSTEMKFLGVFDLGAQPNEILSQSIPKAIPYLLLIVFLVGTSWYQQKQVTARRPQTEGGEENNALAQQQAILKYLPLLTGVWSFFFPTGLSVYWATSNTFRIGQQAYITRALYSKKDDMEASFQEQLEERKASKAIVEKTSKKKKAGDTEAGDGSPEDRQTSKVEQRRARELERKKAIKAKADAKRKSADGGLPSSRITPKGTQPQQRKKKR